ncbi:MAG: transaldolase family protein, partial [Acidimicrobiia bacterium]
MHDLSVKVFADGADLAEIRELAANRVIQGFTTNPTLMRKAGIDDYEGFARDVVIETGDRPISFEVFSDEFDEMHRQALKIASWGEHVNVKVPVTNTRGESTSALVRELAESGVRCNVTALMTPAQVEVVTEALAPGPTAFISVFAGRIADTGRDPMPIMREGLDIMASVPALERIWA